MAAFVCSMPLTASSKGNNVRVLYWNIQNGMWSDQENNYDNFVEYVKSFDPDICVWAECKSHYKSHSVEKFPDDGSLYLPAHWAELAARYGHKYVYVGGERDFYPQAVTSKYPIKNVARILGEEPDMIVSHGAGWCRVTVKGKTFNIVTVHTWPQKYGLNVPEDKRQESSRNHEGDRFRRTEMEYICQHTILTEPKAESQYWMMLGDFNSRARVDNYHYKYPENDTRFLVHDYITSSTPYFDVVAEMYPGDFQKTHINGARIDYVYCTQPLYSHVKEVKVLRDGWAANIKDPQGLSNFCHPSDHYPILIDFSF